ncbi:hypothetical protein POVWA2_042600 [Plasmodium ovale wallikeri]|uniref:Uncharacterized protein n=1 Tax=Plasmodium ovale wallikeri TaxID=864142 RepID=A0A1A8ZDE3_PLAOA|nr:hypothetical protein POVWA2_042600 [Plasmodium ovale wallikeri]SBT56424.1 hypothetical protein POVWA1_076050 [Plasmodium ovale wallikeri]
MRGVEKKRHYPPHNTVLHSVGLAFACVIINTTSPHLKNTPIALTSQFVSWERLLPPLSNMVGAHAPPYSTSLSIG